MAEMRLSHVIIGLVILVLIGAPILICFGFLAIPALDFGWFKTPELTKKNLTQAVDEGVGAATGYTAAKTPTEAMDKFRDAIQNRKYKYAKVYVTKDYADMLERANTAAYDIGTKLDRIREFGKNNGILTDKTAIFLNRLDAFPKNFGSGKAPEMKGDKAYGKYEWTFVEKGVPFDQIANELKSLDAEMYQMVLGPPLIFHAQIELIKEGEDWKLNIPVKANPLLPAWEKTVAYYIDHYKTHDTALEGFISSMTREQYDTPAAFESAVFAKLRAAKK
jgi:hypothetical protein